MASGKTEGKTQWRFWEEEMVEITMGGNNNQLLQIDLNQQDREDEWSVPPTDERRDDVGRQHITQMSPPAAPPPTEERLFTNWSSEGSPRERASQQLQSARSIESRRTLSQMELILREPRDDEVLGHVPDNVMIIPNTQVQTSQVGARLIDRETNTSSTGIGLPREEARTDIICTHS